MANEKPFGAPWALETAAPLPRLANHEMLRQGFEKEIQVLLRARVNVILIMGGTLVPLFGILDALLFPSLFEKLMVYRILAAIICWGLYLLNRQRRRPMPSFALGTIAFYAVGLSIIAMIVDTGGTHTPYYAGLNLVFLTYCVVLPVPVKKLAIHSVVLYAGYVAGALGLDAHPTMNTFFAHNLFILSTLCIILIAAHMDHRHRWRDFVLRHELAQTQAKLEQYSKKLESSVEETETKYRHLVENANDAIFICQEGRIRFPNPRTQTLWGRPLEDLEESLLLEFVVPEDQDALVELFEELERHPQAAPPLRTLRLEQPSGRIVWVDMNVVPMEWQQRPALLCIARDVTDKRQMEQELVQIQKLEAIGTLAGGIAHDFNNILQMIHGCLQILGRHTDADHPHRPLLDKLFQAVDRGANLTRQLLIYGRKTDEKVGPVDINVAVVRVCEMLERVLPKMYRLDLHLESHLGRISADANQLEQVVMNLVMNARDAMPDGGTITIKTSPATVDEVLAQKLGMLRRGAAVRLSIADTGPGIPHEIQDRIYEPFFTTKPPDKGTGLGLAIVYSVIKRFGGGIVCESEPGSGTRFHLYFPVSHAESKEAVLDREEAIPVDLAGLHVLLVDDEPHLLDIGQSLLESYGLHVATASDGESALELLKTMDPKPDGVILDLNMPGMGGAQCLSEILQHYPELPVIIATGYLDPKKREELLSKGATDFVEKPFHFERILHTLQRSRICRLRPRRAD
ncbi:hybrid sensor histidine kinase/response regulator [Desulfosoma caldarium]|uniref:histidine kinase n=1 Tax=Desulfosoma caldarium TaxID=610254 RepID=A0A3N1VK48_9BACT|nr:response regulator [Desulfosoma caldarium]ROR03193.1 PAS domain S-box-containing protein [Desulfosoma caldarium]